MKKFNKVLFLRMSVYTDTWFLEGNSQPNKNYWNSFNVAHDTRESLESIIEGGEYEKSSISPASRTVC